MEHRVPSVEVLSRRPLGTSNATPHSPLEGQTGLLILDYPMRPRSRQHSHEVNTMTMICHVTTVVITFVEVIWGTPQSKTRD